jgi:hypothetical protein
MQMPTDNHLGLEFRMPILRLFCTAPDTESRDHQQVYEVLAQWPVIYYYDRCVWILRNGLFKFGVEGFDEGSAPILAAFVRIGVEEDFICGHDVFFSSPVYSFFEGDIIGPEAVVV